MNSPRFRLLAISIALGLGVVSAQGGVSLKNGDFFVYYTDVIFHGGIEPKLERVYNSKSSYRGLYGYAWSMEYDVYLSVTGDGRVVVHEYGGGADNEFVPARFDEARLDDEIAQLLRAAESARDVTSDEERSTLLKKLKTDALFREREWQKYLRSHLVKSRGLPVGAVFLSNRFHHQTLTRVRDGYERDIDSGRIEEFDVDGRLVSVKDRNNNFIRVTYDVRGKLDSIFDNLGRKMLLKVNDAGLLESVVTDGGHEVVLRYNKADELIYSKDVDGNEYHFEYSPDGAHNLTRISYTDGTSMDMTYYGNDVHQSIKSVKERDGGVTAYEYVMDAKDRGHYSVGVKVSSNDGKPISDSKYEYFIRTSAHGTDWTQRLITTLDGDVTDTEYEQGSGLPLVIRHGGEESRFEYDAQARLTRKQTPTETTEIRYDPNCSKITFVQITSKASPDKPDWSKFEYDARGNLTHAENSEKKTVELSYDSNGRISVLTTQDQTQIKFTYNQNSKPIKIEQVGLGAITVEYDENGEIKKVDSAAGRKIAVQVTASFQSLLDIIRPAGVSLSF